MSKTVILCLVLGILIQVVLSSKGSTSAANTALSDDDLLHIMTEAARQAVEQFGSELSGEKVSEVMKQALWEAQRTVFSLRNVPAKNDLDEIIQRAIKIAIKDVFRIVDLEKPEEKRVKSIAEAAVRVARYQTKSLSIINVMDSTLLLHITENAIWEALRINNNSNRGQLLNIATKAALQAMNEAVGIFSEERFTQLSEQAISQVKNERLRRDNPSFRDDNNDVPVLSRGGRRLKLKRVRKEV